MFIHDQTRGCVLKCLPRPVICWGKSIWEQINTKLTVMLWTSVCSCVNKDTGIQTGQRFMQLVFAQYLTC